MVSLDPLRETVGVVSQLAASEDSDDTPERWDRQSRTSRLWGALTRYPYLTVAVVLFVVAFALFFFPVLPTAHHNGWTLAAGIWLLSLAVTAVMVRKSAYGTLADLDLHVNFMGNSMAVRLGKRDGYIDEKTIGFKELKQFSHGGLKKKWLQFRDRFNRKEIESHKEKYHRVESDGSGEVVHGFLAPLTVETKQIENGIDLFNSVLVTHSGKLDDDLSSKQKDTKTTIPPTIDERTNKDVRQAFSRVTFAQEHEEIRADMADDLLDDLEEYVDPAGMPLFERVNQLVEDAREAKQRDRAVTNGSRTARLPEDNGGGS